MRLGSVTFTGCAVAALLGGCGQTMAVPAPIRAEAETYIRKETGSPTPLVFDEAWMMNASTRDQTVCGEFHGLPLLGDEKVRYFYDYDNDYGQVEMHRYWVTDSAVSQAIMDENRRLFDDLWSSHCKPYRPSLLSRQVTT